MLLSYKCVSKVEKKVYLQAFELRLWPHQHPLRQFEGILAQELLFKMEDRGLWMERLQVHPHYPASSASQPSPALLCTFVMVYCVTVHVFSYSEEPLQLLSLNSLTTSQACPCCCCATYVKSIPRYRCT